MVWLAMKIEKILLKKNSLLIVVSLLFTLPLLSTSITSSNALESSISKEFNLNALTPSSSIEILNDTAFDLYSLPGNGSETDPYRIENLNITTADTRGIYIVLTTKYFVIQNCYIDAGNDGIRIAGVLEGTAKIIENVCVNNAANGIGLYDTLSANVSNNICLDNGNSGIFTDYADLSIFYNNTCKGNDIGIYLYDTYYSFILENTLNGNVIGHYGESIEGNIYEKNNFNDQEDGIVIYNGEYLVIKENTCRNNTYTGMSMVDVRDANISFNTLDDCKVQGLYLYTTNDVIVTNNTITNNLEGIYAGGTYACNFTYNLIKDNTEYGINADIMGEVNVFHHNAFVSNAIGLGNSQAYDNGTNNLWYDVSTNEGNFWNDWVGTGNYSIDGSTGSFDLYPLGSSPIVAEFSISNNLFYVILFISLTSTVSVLMRKFTKRK